MAREEGNQAWNSVNASMSRRSPTGRSPSPSPVIFSTGTRRKPSAPLSLEIHIHPPEQDVQDESVYQVTAQALEQARALGIEGDIEGQIKRMARDGSPYS
jgi:hypothetical protein